MPSQGFLLCFVQRNNEVHGAPNDVGTTATGKSGVDGCLTSSAMKAMEHSNGACSMCDTRTVWRSTQGAWLQGDN